MIGDRFLIVGAIALVALAVYQTVRAQAPRTAGAPSTPSAPGSGTPPAWTDAQTAAYREHLWNDELRQQPDFWI